MVRISEELVRKRAEHNEGLITTLEELTLHQEGIERLECLDKWCRDLRILYLQNNLIPKIGIEPNNIVRKRVRIFNIFNHVKGNVTSKAIFRDDPRNKPLTSAKNLRAKENVSRLKHLEYLNLTLNNVTEIANLEGCESLVKLDLTINFIWKLTSVETLIGNYNLRQLFLVGNPCAEYEGYRSFVIGTLPQLTSLDGLEVTRTERYEADKELTEIRKLIIKQQERYLKKPQRRESFDENHNVKPKEVNDSHNIDENFWTTPTEYTPEGRVKARKYAESFKGDDGTKDTEKETKPKERNLFAKDGRPLNINEAKLDFKLTEDEDGNIFVLEIKLFKYLETSDVTVDSQPDYIRLWVKGKIFQLVLPENVHPDTSKAERSRASGKLLIRMPKARLTKVIVKSGNSKEYKGGKINENGSSKKTILKDEREKFTQIREEKIYPDDMPKLI